MPARSAPGATAGRGRLTDAVSGLDFGDVGTCARPCRGGLPDRPGCRAAVCYTPPFGGLAVTRRTTSIATLRNMATRLRIDSIRSTTEAGSGHPTTCMSAAEVVAALFFHEMRYDVGNPRHEHADRFILSKGHAAPILYAAWANAGLFPRDEQLKLRRLESDLEGHPTPRLPFVDVATGSLGQGLPVGIGTALNARRIGSDYRTYVLLGDGESAEGSVWEAAASGAFFGLDNLCGITDVNLLGQSRATQLGHDLDSLSARWAAFGWHAVVIDGHDLDAILKVFEEARDTTGRPTMILAKTFKGHGVSFLEGQGGLARQAAEEGRRGRQGHRGAGGAVRGRRRRRVHDPGALEAVGARRADGDAGAACAGLQAR